jgi:hypothetical protein
MEDQMTLLQTLAAIVSALQEILVLTPQVTTAITNLKTFLQTV